MLRSFLGVEPDEPNKTLRVRAKLPKAWGEVSLDGLRLGESTASLRARRDDVVVDGLPPSWRIERS
jgi:hypothetical protein